MQTLTLLLLCLILWQLFRIQRSISELEAPVPVLPYAPDLSMYADFAVSGDSLGGDSLDLGADFPGADGGAE